MKTKNGKETVVGEPEKIKNGGEKGEKSIVCGEAVLKGY